MKNYGHRVWLQGEAALSILSHVDLKQFAFHLWPDKAAVAQTMGLAKLTALILGKQLDKTQQVCIPFDGIHCVFQLLLKGRITCATISFHLN